MWSRAMLKAIEMARWGAGALGEVDRIGRHLRGRVGDDEAWHAEWSAMARRLEQAAQAQLKLGRELTAGG